MCQLVILVILLVQVLSAFGTKCTVDIRRKDFGQCVEKEACSTETLFQCGNGLFCCQTAVKQPIVTRVNLTPNNLHCGETPNYPKATIVGGYHIKPNEYSWVASLEYNYARNSFGYCAGRKSPSIRKCVSSSYTNYTIYS